MLRRTERLPTKPSNKDVPSMYLQDFIAEMLFKLDVKMVKSEQCTPRSDDDEELSKAPSPR